MEFSIADWKAGDERLYTGIVRDITERKNAEQEFLRSMADLWLREEALGQISQGVVITGADQLVTYVNAGFEDITGYSFKEMLGKSCSLLEGPDTQPEVAFRIRAALDTAQPFHGEVLTRRKDGTSFWNELSINPVFDLRGHLSQFIGVLRDVTQRKHSEAGLLEYSQHLGQMVGERTAQLRALTLELMASEARERRVIAADLHDGLGQSLAVATLKLTALVHPEGGESKDDFLRQLQEIEDTIDRSNATVRSLSTQLSPPVLYQFGLGAALEWLTEEMMRTYGLSVELSLGGLPQLDETVSSALFRIVRELLINVWKHAEVSKAEVSASSDAAGGELSIVVADAGVGFDVEHLLKPSVNNSYGLFSIRERVAFLGGTMRIDSGPGRGATVMIGLALGSKVQTMIEGERK